MSYRRNSVSFEADYLELVKDLPTITLSQTKPLAIFGPTAFPVVAKEAKDEEGHPVAYAQVAAGSYGKVSICTPILSVLEMNKFQRACFEIHHSFTGKILDSSIV